MAKNKRRNKAKAGKKAVAQAEVEKAATNVSKPVAKNQGKFVARAGPQPDAVTESKAMSKKKYVAEKKKGPMADSSSKAEAEPSKKSHFHSVAEASAESKSKGHSKTGTDSLVWVEEGPSTSSRFGSGEGGNYSGVKNEVKAKDVGPPVCAGKSEPVSAASCKAPKEEEDEDDVIGTWFWDGDEASFDPNPKPVSRIIRPQPVDEINEKDRPKDWSEVTIWPKAPAVTPSVLGFRPRNRAGTKPPSFIVLASADENANSKSEAGATAGEGAVETIAACTGDIYAGTQPEIPFGSETCVQTIEEIRRQIKFREMNGIKPFACPCKMECYMNSEEFERLVSLLKSTTDPLIHKIAQIAMGIIDVHPFAQEFINEVGVVTLIESLLSFPSSEMRKKAVITLNPPTGDEKLRKAELHVRHMCQETLCFPLNSPGQQSGLKILGQLTANANHHHIVINCFPDFFNLLSQGNRKTRNLVLKVLLNLSESPIAARDMTSTEALAALKLVFHQKEAKANLVSAVAIFINIKEHIRKGSMVVVDHESYNSLMTIFREVKGIIETM